MRSKQVADIAAALRIHDDYLIATHQRADGDALGAMAATILVLEELGKNYMAIVNEDAPDQRYSFLPGFDRIHGWSMPRRRTAAIILDAPTEERLDRVADLLPPPERRLVIDHHTCQQAIGRYTLIDASASSTCELLYEIIQALHINLNPALATCLLTGIVFDTGRFRFSNSTTEAFRTAAELVEAGADPEFISEQLFFRKTPASMRLLGETLRSLQLHCDGRIAIQVLTNAAFHLYGGDWFDLEGFVDYGVAVAGVEVAALVKEIRPGECKVSLRSRNAVDVNRLAEMHGGGGHTKAAGYSISGSPEEAVRGLLGILSGLLPVRE